jgi:uncharacterized protein (DUF1015 family)
VPEIRPFRALRYEPDAVGDLALVVSPPYDVISDELQRELLARHPKNIVRLDLPPDEPGDEPDDRYRRAARTFAAWRSDGTLRKDPRASIYVYEQAYVVPGTSIERTQRGFLGRLRLEPFEAGGGVLPHERTMSGPKEDRYKLLRATGANFSPIVALYADESGRAAARLALLAGEAPAIQVTDDDGVRHRLWAVTEDGTPDGAVAELARAAGSGPVTIADGHHRYETALRYRDERRMTRSCEEDPPFDYVLTLFLETTAEPLTVLPTHRVVRGVGDAADGHLEAAARELFAVRSASASDLRSAFGPEAQAPGGRGRIGLWTRAGGAILDAPAGRDAGLDTVVLGAVLERLVGIDPDAVAAGGRIVYTKSVDEALAMVDGSVGGADAAFLLEPTPVPDVVAAARAGKILPQKSTYFYPKPLSGLVINPHEW